MDNFQNTQFWHILSVLLSCFIVVSCCFSTVSHFFSPLPGRNFLPAFLYPSLDPKPLREELAS